MVKRPRSFHTQVKVFEKSLDTQNPHLNRIGELRYHRGKICIQGINLREGIIEEQ